MIGTASDAAADNPRDCFTNPPVVLLSGETGLPRELLGNKGYGVDVMRRHGLPVPPAFCITTEVCRRYFVDPDHTIETIWNDVLSAMRWLENETARSFGTGPRPLLVSVRSGGAQSMPGMLDTVLNLGIDNTVYASLAESFTSSFAADTRERFRSLYRRVVVADQNTGIPDDPYAQLRGAIEAVFRSWHSSRAQSYRRHHDMDDAGGTAVVVQAMVFGNLDANTSGSGVLFSRNPMTGADEPFGEWLAGGQGADVVSGTKDCQPVSALRAALPGVYEELVTAAATLERLGRDVQDIEFTVEEGRLWLLQMRSAKRSAQAAVRLALKLYEEGVVDAGEALRRVHPAHVEALLLPSLQPETRFSATLLAKGLPACPGVASGRVYSDVGAAIDAAERGEDVILVRPDTSPDDVQGMLAARAIVTEVGGATSHAAIVSREIGRPAVVGCGAGIATALDGKLVTVDGTEGEVREGILELRAWSITDSPDLQQLADLARRVSPLRAHAEGNYPRLQDNSDATVREALAAGHTDVVSGNPLIAMLAAVRAADEVDIGA
ncbi:pyruvate, phosphate dikinase [Mycobacterium sp. 852002-51163_SCH5372311]|uniref:pyruvate, phosphate dikinase n=1 Tax=Mycobacterium sp. 852002-51163_SCH5372311 TaxID=1834097 RepID=UPI0007FD82CD|nr:pyruvate, phosphate dikinase [Mycobacterium sp. 852002-51163_SCH5372311]OBF80785.1 pyruvate, phosphate dikinase [Mycobacterium sp. 852002-51163_SCH5372311]